MNKNYPEQVSDKIKQLMFDCRICHQCGRCTSACPSGWDLNRGPRLMIRLLLSGNIDEILSCEDMWRCCECGSCSRACPMLIDIAGILSKLRLLELEYGIQKCPEREATQMAISRLAEKKHVNIFAFGMKMALRGFLPRDLKSAASTAARMAVQTLLNQRMQKVWRDNGSVNLSLLENTDKKQESFFAGCVLQQDPLNYQLILRIATALGIHLMEADSGACCGHPTRGAQGPALSSIDKVLTVCPGCESSLLGAGIKAKPLWESFVDKAKRDRHRFTAKKSSFVPYVGCMGDRDRALASLTDASRLAGIKTHVNYPSHHAICCGALGSSYRGETKATTKFLEYAVSCNSSIVTTCLLCRDNLRSAARRQHAPVQVYFWPEFFQVSSDRGLISQGGIHVPLKRKI